MANRGAFRTKTMPSPLATGCLAADQRQRIGRLCAAVLFLCLGFGANAESIDPWSRLSGRLTLADCKDDARAQTWRDYYYLNDSELEHIMRRAEPWIELIVDQVLARDLPGELALLPIIESRFDPFATSVLNAAGIWQFRPDTAREHGLTIDPHYDARRDPLAATPAALDYLQELHARFDGDWRLALAAYNAGPTRIARATSRADRRRDRSVLPGETRVYLARLFGLSCLFQSPDGLTWHSAPAAVPSAIEMSGPIDLVAWIRAAGLSPDLVFWLNPGLNDWLVSAPGRRRVVVPSSAAQAAQRAALRAERLHSIVWAEANVRRRDTLDGIARRHQTTVAALRLFNPWLEQLPNIGDRLVIPSPNSRPDEPGYRAVLERLAELRQGHHPDERLRHRVEPGETLWVLAQRYSVSRQAILRHNELDRESRIQPGLWIEIPAGVPVLRPHQYRVEPGDTLWSIAAAHGLPINQLLALNGLQDNAVIVPGDVLRVGRGGGHDPLPSLFDF